MIETERLLLRPWRADDRPALAAILGDPVVMRFSDHGPLDEAAQAAWLCEAMQAQERWAIMAADTGPIGYVSLSDAAERVQPGDGELGMRLRRDVWGQGYAVEAARGVTRAKQGTFARLVAIVDPTNTRSVRLVKKLGFTFDRDIAFEGYNHPDHLFVADQPAGDITLV